jgi:putative DNA primase/helicase
MTPVDEIRRALAFLHPVDFTFELCGIGPEVKKHRLWGDDYAGGKKPIVAGWFSDQGKAAEVATPLDAEARPEGIYVTLNPTSAALLGRADHRLRASVGRTQDAEVVRLINLLIDADPVRPAGISATDDEKDLAREMSRAIYAFLRKCGWPDPLCADSGNGDHLVYKIDLPNTPENVALVKRVLQALAARFDTDAVKVDLSVFNPARLVKLWGTVARKGDDTADRPHRRSAILHIPADTQPVPRELLDALAAEVEDATPPTREPRENRFTGDGQKLDVVAYCRKYGVTIKGEKQHGTSTLYVIDPCVFNPEHSGGEAAIGQCTDGKLFYQCYHNSCQGRTWAEARQVISGDDPLFEIPKQHRPRRSQQAATKEADKAAAHIVLARLVVTSYGQSNIRYTNGSFWMWAGGVWKRTDDRAVKQRIHEKCEKEIASQNTVNSILELCKTEVYAEDVLQDVECRFINCINGELHWTGSEWELRPHNRAHFSTSQLPVAYDPQAPAPRFEQFLTEVFRDDPDAEEKAVIVCEALGYSLLSTCEFEKFFLLIGNGANGKSVLLRLLEDLAGPGNVAAVQPSQFDNKFQRAHLHCQLVNLVSEIAEGAEIADAQLKAIVSGELTTVEHKMQKPFDFRPYCTCWFGTNHLPHTRDFSAALFRRAVVLTFNRTFAPDEQDQRLRDKLRDELPGVLNLALEGMAGVFDRGGFTSAASVEAAKDAWKLEADQVAQFADECLKFERAAQTASAELYRAYESWADDAGIKRSLNRKNFTNRICRLGAEIHKGSGGVRLLVGVQIAHEAMQ